MTTNPSSPSWLSLLGLSVTITLAGCTSMVNVPAPDTTPIHTTDSASSDHPVSNADGFTQCPPFNPKNNICTMQYEPVCVKVTTASGGVNYRTAGNACSACGTSAAIEYSPGPCP